MVAKANGQPIDEILAAARRRLNRLDPAAAQAAMRATDMDGGFVAWASAGLPVQPGHPTW